MTVAYPPIRTSLYLPAQPPMSLLNQQLLAARFLGLDGIMIWDHFQDFTPAWLWTKDITWVAQRRSSPHPFYDFSVLLGHLAGRVGGLRLGVGVTDVTRRHPIAVAQSMLTLAHLTRRPPILGLGAGEVLSIVPYGLDFSQPVGRLEEGLQIIRRCFTSTGPFDFAGQHFRLDGAIMDLAPPPGQTPEIWLAAHGPRMLRLTGQYADGWYPSGLVSPETYAERLAAIHAAARAAGRDPAAITPSLHVGTVIGPSEVAVKALIDTPAVRYATLVVSTAADWQRHGKVHPLGDDFRSFVNIVAESYSQEQVRDGMAAVWPELTREVMACGTPGQLVATFRNLGEAGLRHVNLILISAYPSQRTMFDTVRGLRTIAGHLQRGA